MAKGQSQRRIEPTLDDTVERGGLRLRASDRVQPDDFDDEDEDYEPRPRTKRPARDRAEPARAASSAKSSRKAARSRRARKPRRSLLWALTRGTVYWCMVLGLWGLIGFAGLMGYTMATMPQISKQVVPPRPPNIEIVDTFGRLIANRGDTGGEAVRLADLPPHVPQAVIAIEDRRFYSHFGIDPIGLARAIGTNALRGEFVQGGSTITQQLAKNLFLEPDRTLQRKLQEAALAFWLEWTFSKDQILEMYLNRVYLGGGAYGVDGAARRYYARPATELTLRQAAVLAGVLKAPSRYAPSASQERADGRARLVLAAMVEEGFIDGEDARRAMAEPATLATAHRSSTGNYVADWVMDLLPGYVAAVDGDLVVKTTVDLDLQRAAEAALRETLATEGAKFAVSQGALVALDGDGAVRALVGGRDYAKSQFDRAVEARRQPGSAFKPFVYLAALERGWLPDDIMVDEPVSIGGWTPRNYSGEYLGPVTLATALARSLNTVAARLGAEVGPANVAETARRLGIVSRLHEQPSIALGTAEVTPLELTAAYVPFSNGGEAVIPHVVESISSKDGRVLFQRQGGRAGRVVDPAVIGSMNRMMQQVLEVGTGQKAVLPGRPAGGKTGTSQDFRDAWFIGYVNGFTAGVWLGNDDNSSTKKATGGALTALVWRRFMEVATEGTPVAALPGVDLYLPRAGDTSIAAGDGLPVPGSIDALIQRAREVPASGPTHHERTLLERLFGG